MVPNLFIHLDAVIQQYPGKKFIVAYSGGMDSHVLVHALQSVLKKRKTRALKSVHINHHLSISANQWVSHCQSVCHELGLGLDVLDVQVNRHGSLEQEARQARYGAWKNYLKADEILCLAHHADDQAETVLLQLMRGAGPKGLSAMPEHSQLGEGQLLRPLLSIDQSELKAYARQHHLRWIEDESNEDIRFDRNFIRHHVMPQLKSRWPSMTKTVGRSARLCAQQETYLSNLILSSQDIEGSNSAAPQTLNTGVSSHQPIQRLPHIALFPLLQGTNSEHAIWLRQWLASNHLPMPSEKKCQTMLEQMTQAREDKNPCVKWGDYALRRYRHRLYVTKAGELNSSQVIEWDGESVIDIPGIGKVSLECLSETLILSYGAENRLKSLINNGLENSNKKQNETLRHITIRFRHGGEKFLTAAGHRPLKKCFQDWGVPPWLRHRIPLIFVDKTLVAVVSHDWVLDNLCKK